MVLGVVSAHDRETAAVVAQLVREFGEFVIDVRSRHLLGAVGAGSCRSYRASSFVVGAKLKSEPVGACAPDRGAPGAERRSCAS